MMDGGYMLPEYGVAYIKRVRFFKEKFKERLTDLIAAACKYCHILLSVRSLIRDNTLIVLRLIECI
jgi:hypothetical protein